MDSKTANPNWLHLRMAPRCSAMSKRTRCPCQAPAMRGKRVCRFHGGTAGAPPGARNGMFKHGRYTNEAMATRREIADLLRRSRELLKEI
ncbi:MAG: hypothetical protein FJX53_12790 [Alphaproteobacteria bacterium]|nr:hypothetical protein [Alphaproteobacteria bacterium]